MCQVWKHSEVIKHRSPRTRDLAATGEVTWREVPEVQKAVWKRQQQRHQKNRKSISLVRALRPERSLLGGGCLQLHVYICSNCFCCFHVNAQLHLRKQGSRKANRSASSISNFGLDSGISLFIFISVVWTQKLTAFQWCTLGPNCYWWYALKTPFDLFVLVNWRSMFYCTV